MLQMPLYSEQWHQNQLKTYTQAFVKGYLKRPQLPLPYELRP